MKKANKTPKFHYQKYWKPEVNEYVQTLFEHLENKGLSSPNYYPSIYTFAENFNNFLLAQEILSEKGLLIPNEKGTLVTNPAYGVSTRAQNIFLSILKELGMSPKAEKYVKSEMKPEETALDKLFAGALDDDE